MLPRRPTAEKLLQHQFFKQPKRRDYLVKTLLADLAPLEQRPHKKIPQRQISITKTDEWDFQDEDEDKRKEPQPVKRHISFGDVVVKNPPQPYAASVHAEVTAPTKKSRFVVEETSPREAGGEASVPCSRQASVCDSPKMLAMDSAADECVKKGRFSVKQNDGEVSSSSTTTTDKSLIKSASQDNIAGITTLDRKSRFVIDHGDQSVSSSSPQLAAVVASLSRDNSMSSSNGHALTRDNSSHSRLPARYQSINDNTIKDENSRKIGRFELSSEPGRMVDKGESAALHPYEYSSSSGTSPSSSLSRGQLVRAGSEQAVTTLQTQMEELIKANESQRHLLHELSGMLKSSAPPPAAAVKRSDADR